MGILNRKNLLTLIFVIVTYAIVQGLIVTDILPPLYVSTLIQVCIYVVLAVSLNLINGITGQFSIGHAGFMAIGAYLAGVATVKFHSPLLIALIIGGIVAAAAGFIVGLPTLRLRGDYLAIATLGLGEIVRIVFQNLDYFGGAAGMQVGRHINWSWAFWVTVISLVIIHNFVYSTHGRACISIRENEIAAEAMGINTTKYKVLAFTMGAFFAGVAGGVYANYMYFIQPTTFNFLTSFNILVMVVLGGLGSMTGSILGALIMTVLNMALSGIPSLRMVITALLLIIMMIFRPSGLMGTKEFSLNFLDKKGERDVA